MILPSAICSAHHVLQNILYWYAIVCILATIVNLQFTMLHACIITQVLFKRCSVNLLYVGYKISIKRQNKNIYVRTQALTVKVRVTSSLSYLVASGTRWFFNAVYCLASVPYACALFISWCYYLV